MKKVLCFVLVLAMVISSVPVFAADQKVVTVNNMQDMISAIKSNTLSLNALKSCIESYIALLFNVCKDINYSYYLYKPLISILVISASIASR